MPLRKEAEEVFGERTVQKVVEDVESVVQDVRTKVEEKVELVKTKAKEVLQTPVVEVAESMLSIGGRISAENMS